MTVKNSIKNFYFFGFESIWHFFLYMNMFLSACSHNDLYNQFRSFPYSKWDAKKEVRFEILIQNVYVLYDTFIELRYTNFYPFRNLWLFVKVQTPQGTYRQDTFQVELADIHGRWYGKGIQWHTSSYFFPTSYLTTGKYIYTIHHGMCKNQLKGISEIGLRVVKKSHYLKKNLN